jgi:1-acyl-sn-glycerol-3-phosphate acyltransferase
VGVRRHHQSFLDIFSLFRLFRPFKFVSKTSVFMFPIVGWSMFLTGHIGLKRTDRRSQVHGPTASRSSFAGDGVPRFGSA